VTSGKIDEHVGKVVSKVRDTWNSVFSSKEGQHA